MLIHVPVYAAPGASEWQKRYLLELVLASLDSYYACGNRYDVWVTTNDTRVSQELSRYRSRSHHPFSVTHVTEQDLALAFGAVEARTLGSLSLCYVLSKFYPIVRRYAKQIVHVDYDTLFLSRADFSPLFTSDVGLVDTNQFGNSRKWIPTAPALEFFRMDRKRIRPVAAWINSGVFSVQRAGFDLCSEEVAHFLSRLPRAVALGYNDEAMMNALAVREPEKVAVTRDFRFNFLAYHLGNDPNWWKTAKIVHFHSMKPHIFGGPDGVPRPSQVCRSLCASDHFYLAVLLWCRHLHAAARHLDTDFQMLRAMPLQFVLGEERRVTDALCLRANAPAKRTAPLASAASALRGRVTAHSGVLACGAVVQQRRSGLHGDLPPLLSGNAASAGRSHWLGPNRRPLVGRTGKP